MNDETSTADGQQQREVMPRWYADYWTPGRWYCLRLFKRPWTWKLWAHTDYVVFACGWGWWAMQLMETTSHPNHRDAA